jgi:hypothetical protein
MLPARRFRSLRVRDRPAGPIGVIVAGGGALSVSR